MKTEEKYIITEKEAMSAFLAEDRAYVQWVSFMSVMNDSEFIKVKPELLEKVLDISTKIEELCIELNKYVTQDYLDSLSNDQQTTESIPTDES